MTKTARKIFSDIINCEISLYTTLYGPDKAVVPISDIIRFNEGLSRYSARKALKELIKEDLICFTSQGRPAIESIGEYRELVCEAMPPVNGYALTRKGFESEPFRESYKAWEKSMAEWAEGGSND